MVSIYLQKNFELFFYLSKYSLSDTHLNTGRLLFEFNRLQYTLAAPEVFVSSANPVSLPSGYRISIVRNTRSKPHPYGIACCMLDTVEHAYSRHSYTACRPALDCPQEDSRGPGKVDLHAVLARCLGNTPGSTFQSTSLHLKRSMGDC